jgi:hypothetical protein
MTRPPVLAAIALVCLTNLGALGMSALNRASLDGSLTLTEREMRLVRPRDSVTLLRIMWVQPSSSWFGVKQAERAGFDTSVSPTAPGAELHYRRQLPREVYVALECDGPALIAYRDAVLKRDPPNIGAFNRFDSTQPPTRERAMDAHTRLVAVALDADPTRLRTEYPEASQYLISRARVGVDLSVETDNRRTIVARIVQLLPAELNVPRPFSEILRDLTRPDTRDRPDNGLVSPRFAVDVKYGRSHQPWIEDLRSHR